MLGLTEIGLKSFPIRYTSFSIPKKTGGRRTLLAPNTKLKARQKIILRSILYNAKPHPYVYGFRKRKSIVDNARPHCDAAVVIKLDIQNFFPSITQKQVQEVFEKEGWSQEAAKILVRICCYEGRLPQGAPTSPAISNMVLKPVDIRLNKLAKRNNASFSRYADDITFSLPTDDKKAVRALIKVTQLELAKHDFRLNFKKGKIRVLRKHQHQEICGITVNTDKPTLSRKKRRLLRSIKHRLDNDIPATMTRNQLDGWQNFNRMVDAEPHKIVVEKPTTAAQV